MTASKTKPPATSTARVGRPPWAAIVLGGHALALAVAAFYFFRPQGEPPSSLLFVGRFHVLVVHLPIGLLCGLLAAEGLRWGSARDGLEKAVDVLLVLTASSATVAALLGLALAGEGIHDTSTLVRHRWLGLGFAALALAAAALRRLERRGRGGAGEDARSVTASRSAIATAAVLVILAGHTGGSLTHGPGYLVEYAPSWIAELGARPNTERAASSKASGEIYSARIAPLLRKYCQRCHGATKSRSHYRLDNFADMLRAGESGEPPIVPFEPMRSHLVEVLTLPEDDPYAMPPTGEPRMGAGEILAIVHWVADGAPGPGGDGAERG